LRIVSWAEKFYKLFLVCINMTSILKEIIANTSSNTNTIEEKASSGPFASVRVEKRELPITADYKWKVIEIDSTKSLEKTFVFSDLQKRSYFVKEILEREAEINHFAQIEIFQSSVKVILQTKTINVITELDKEYAKFIDGVYKDLITS
jgi:pterin-4a-carbinolamine dehydratase